jgi:hypothetical protein
MNTFDNSTFNKILKKTATFLTHIGDFFIKSIMLYSIWYTMI